MKTYLVYYFPYPDSEDCQPDKEIFYCGTDKVAALVAIRTERLITATIETWENGKQIASRNYSRLADTYSVIDDPNF